MLYTVNTTLSDPDYRDFRFIPDSEGPFPASLDLLPFVQEVEDQDVYGTCVANGLCSQAESIAKANSMSFDLSRMYLYMRGRQISGLGPETEGMIPRGAYKALKQWGSPDESSWPYVPENQHAIPPPIIDQLAGTRKAIKYEAVIPPGDSQMEAPERIMKIKAALNQGMQVGYASWVTESLRHLAGDWKTHNYLMLDQDDMIGAHFWLIIGYDDASQRFLCQNSWGSGYGDGGFFGLHYHAVAEIGVEAWVLRNYNGWYNRQAPSIRRELINFANLNFRIVPPLELVGQTRKLWIVAKSPDNVWRYKPDLNVNNFAAVSGPVPECAEIVLEDVVNDLFVLRDYDIFGQGLRPFAGWNVYVGYGLTYAEAHAGAALICTIPNNL